MVGKRFGLKHQDDAFEVYQQIAKDLDDGATLHIDYDATTKTYCRWDQIKSVCNQLNVRFNISGDMVESSVTQSEH